MTARKRTDQRYANYLDVLRDRDPHIQEHEPPHFHAEYQGQQAKFDFDGRIVAGVMRFGTARHLIKEWASQHRSELETNWTRMKVGQALDRIAPLE